jgi:hypothetical protein
MKAIWLISVAVCTAGAGGAAIAQAHEPAPARVITPAHKNAPNGLPCLLGMQDCLGVIKTPATACLVAKGKTSSDACAVDGMKLIGKLTV